MHKMSQFKLIREQMMEEVTQIPQYRALKAMERFMGEIAEIYGASSAFSESDKSEDNEMAPQTQEGRVVRDAAIGTLLGGGLLGVHALLH